MFPGLEKGLCVPFFKSRVTSRKSTVCLFTSIVILSPFLLKMVQIKLLLNQICLSGSCFGNSETIVSVKTKVTRITETPLLSGAADMRQQGRTIRRHHNYPW